MSVSVESEILDLLVDNLATWEQELNALVPVLSTQPSPQRDIRHMAAGMAQVRTAVNNLRAAAGRSPPASE
jgi:hypothetical protein